MTKFLIPPLDDLLDPSPVERVEYEKTFEEARSDPFVAIHTSGSTGTPKLVILKHGSFCCVDAYQALEPNEIGQRCGNQRLLSPFPQFHVAGLLYQLTVPIFVDSTVVCAPSVPLTADVVNNMHIHGRAEFSSLPPSIIVDLCKNEEYLGNLSKLRGLNYAGGPLSEATGEIVAKRTCLTTNIGSSEYLAACLLPKSREDWRYFKFNEQAIGMEFRLQDSDSGLYEMVFVKKPELKHIQAVFVTFPDLQEFSTKDLFEKHPSKRGLWKYASRSDDIIVSSSGENLNPVTIEGIMTSAPDVKGSLVVGQGRSHAAVLIEPTNPSFPHDELLDKIEPYVDRANEATIKHGNIARDAILVTSEDNPLPRASKGTIQRAAANKLYMPEIHALYDGSNIDISRESTTIDLTSLEATRQSLLDFLSKFSESSTLQTEDDLIDFGIDSI